MNEKIYHMKFLYLIKWLVRITWIVLTSNFAHFFIKLELNNEGNKVSDVRYIIGKMEFGSRIKVFC